MNRDRCPEHPWCAATNCGACRSEQLAADVARPSPIAADPQRLDIYDARRARAAIKTTEEEQ